MDPDDMNGSSNLEYIEGLPQNRLPGAFVPEFRESSDLAIAQGIPQTRMDSPVPKHHRMPQITMPSFAFVTTNGTALNAPIPFGRANTVRVDNLTPQWCRVSGVYVNPNSIGWYIPIQNATQAAILTWESPATVTQPGATTGANAYTIWYEERFPAQVGVGTVTTTTVAAPTTGTETNVAGSASSVTILASNSSRKAASIYNDSSAILYLLLGTGPASTTVYTVQMASNTLYEVLANYTGIITGIWASATGSARVTELT